ncbi:hypothetical protein GCM10010520_36700 [Rhizobium viscosum]|uniref:DUF4174 domain-containing protein n=1 Tax=Rhizobium viscosum TaxID=1673 RepID=A0ABR9ISB1_RHIVS|nr:DUF4174 domain-containing protein [Rhizobium viscosum]MBE1506079.1 hypothetical protein [Rhizobium viscosum]
MLRSILHEIMGTGVREAHTPRSLEQFLGEKNVLIVFADAEDDRPIVQDELLRKSQMRLIEDDIEVFTIAGGGAFSLFEGGQDLDADELRDELQGPLSGEFGLVLVGTDGKVKMRSSEPMSVEEISRAADISSPGH